MWCRIVQAGLISLGLVAAIATSVSALDVPKAPPLERPIIDTTSTLSEQEINQLVEQINQSRTEKSYQLGILMIPSLGSGETIEGFSIKVAREWGIGDEDKDNGVLLIIAKDDRKLRLEVGRGLEGDITDAEAGRIIRNVISPEFRNSNYYSGISKAINSIQLAVEDKADPSAADKKRSERGIVGTIIFILFLTGFPMMYIVSLLARSKSWWAGGVVGGVIGAIISVATSFSIPAVLGSGALVGIGLLVDYLVSKNYREAKKSGRKPDWWAGGGGGWDGGSWGGGGSDGGSFGGGGFSGGGASGGW